MPVTIVDPLEVLEIAHDHADRMPPALRQNQLTSEGFLKVAAVVELGESDQPA